MGFSARDVVPFTQARANLSELAEQAKAGAEKIITKNGESYVALIDADRLDYYHRLERERIHLLLLEDARRGLDDIAAGRTRPADAPQSAEALTLLTTMPPGTADSLREYLHGDYLMLYTVVDELATVYLLTIRHHRQLSFDFAGLWPAGN